MRAGLRVEIEHAAATLAEVGVQSARAEAEELAAHAAGTSRGMLTHLDTVDDEFVSRYAKLVAERSRRIPLQYIIGTAAFGPVHLHVGPGVFIPRPETESVLDWASRVSLTSDPLIVDLCTGSGALAVALARHRPSARVIAIDNSAAALDYACRNVAGTQVELHEGDVADSGLMPELNNQVDLIVANPPYLPEGAELEPEVAAHDPHQALFGGGDGMAIIGPIVELAARWLRTGGLIAVEHDDSASTATVELFARAGVFDQITPRKDLVGRFRFVTARRST